MQYEDLTLPMMVSSATFVANRYGINERTVRDIWKQRTWARVTCSIQQNLMLLTKRNKGRPFGSKDTKPRKQKLTKRTISTHSLNSSPLEHNARPFYEPYPIPAYQDISAAEFLSPGGAPQRQMFSFPRHRNSGSESLLVDDLSFPFQAEETSIDDQLHAWANHAPRWIADAALPRRAPLLSFDRHLGSKSSIC